MLGWPNCVQRKTTKRYPFHSRLFLERLESRNTPSAPSLTLNAPLANTPTAPSLTVTASIVGGNWVSVTGQVTCDGSPCDAVVNFTGALVDSTSPGSDGSYGVCEQIPALGTIDAQVTDGAGQQSGAAEVTITAPAPNITLTYSYGAGGAVTLAGQVTADTPANLTVTFGGAVKGITQTDTDGNFSLTTSTQLTGTITAQTTDVWGQASNVAQVTLGNAPPTITNFRAIAGTDNLWTFQGQVSDECAAGLTVQLSGIPTLNGNNGYTAVTVDASGNFALTVRLQQGESGPVSAQTWDWLGIASNVATDVVTPTAGGSTGGGSAAASGA